MRFRDIEVSGVVNIIFNRKTRFKHLGTGVWQRVVLFEKEEIHGRGVYTHEQMMDIVNCLKADRRFRMWIHVDTLNVVRRRNGEDLCPDT